MRHSDFERCYGILRAFLRMASGLISVTKRRFLTNLDANTSRFTFVQLADPQLALLERYGEKRDPPYKWDRELALVDRAISAINRLSKKPKFVIICGDLVDAEPGRSERQDQISDLKSSLAKISPDTPIFVLPGNHDIGNSPSPADIGDYTSYWGDDYFTFWCGKVKNIVVNSQLYFDHSSCQAEFSAQDGWLDNELSASENENAENILIFQHIPPFKKSPSEEDDYFNLPIGVREDLLNRYYKAGVRYLFSGHLHYNSGGLWHPQGGNSSTPLEIISSSAVGFQLGHDKPGLRIVRVTSTTATSWTRGLLRFLLLSNRTIVVRASSTGSKYPSTSLLPSLRVTHETVRDFNIPLTTGKSMKPKPQRFAPPHPTSTEKLSFENNLFRVSAYGIGQSINLAQVSSVFDYVAMGYRCLRLPPEVTNEILFLSTLFDVNDPTKHRDILVFKTGVVVFWNVSESECEETITKIRKECNRPISPEAVEFEELIYSFTRQVGAVVAAPLDLDGPPIMTPLGRVIYSSYHLPMAVTVTFARCQLTEGLRGWRRERGSRIPRSIEKVGPTRLDVEDIRLHALPPRSDANESQDAYEKAVQTLAIEKIAFSDALASSVKLSLLENSFDAVAVQMQPWIDKMQTGLGMFFPMSSVIRKTGELFTLRHLLNVSTTISETPDFYWDRSDVEKLFQNLKSALSVRSRTRILNSKLDTCCELAEILTNHLQARHSSRLEWMIIVLILIEVIFEVQRSRSGKGSQDSQKKRDT
uniref:Calcineurin-like phosphoesterase domain-containing protein n=1 Tax=Echinococcus canadensis TaxID=519352 RepID=A0A915EVC7_9CEST